MSGMQKEIGLNNLPIYNLSHGKSLPEWLKGGKTNKRALRHNEEFRQRLELIQGFEFPVACSRVKMTRDKQYFYASGVYRPVIKVFEVEELSQKFERHVDTEVIQMHALEDDYSKLVILGADRTISFHTKAGPHYTTRMPRPGRDILYESSLCDLYAVGNCSQAYRLNLEQGRWMIPLDTSMESINCIAMAAPHHMLAFGGPDGAVECFDPRAKRSLGVLSATPPGAEGCDISCLAFDPKGLSLAVGTSTGHISMYDLRMAHPLLVKDHRYDSPIVGIFYHGQDAGTMVTADTKVVKIWNRLDGKVIANIEPPAAINDLCIPEADGGLIVLGCEQPKIQTYYLPTLGPAPRWCSFLDGLTEELEQDQTANIYDDFKFVTQEEIEKLGITKLIGTGVLRPYMHGYFMDIRLYHQIQQLENPFAYEEYRKQKIQEKLKKQLDNRIALRKKPKATVSNQSLPDAVTQDSRFSALLQRPELFRIDPDDPDFQKVRQKSTKGKGSRKIQADDDLDDDLDDKEDDLDDLDDKEDDLDDDDDDLDDEDDDLDLYELDPAAINPLDQPVTAGSKDKHRIPDKHLVHVPLASRVKLGQLNKDKSSVKRTGNLEMVFNPQSKQGKTAKKTKESEGPQRKPRKFGRFT